MLQDVLDRRFRANRAFDLVPPDQLPAQLRPSPESAAEALLVPNGQTAVTAKALNADATALVRSLNVVGHLPSGTSGVAANAAVARLVLDGALEIEHDDGFVTGPRAHGAVFATGEPASPRGRLGELSADALRYASALGLGDVGELSWRLYGYGAIPHSTRLDRLLDGDLSARLDGYEAHLNPGWLAWTRCEQRAALPFKLYVSPQPVELDACFGVLTHVLVEHEAPSFKVGRGVHGRLRPDKLVVYLPDFDRLQRLASAVRQALVLRFSRAQERDPLATLEDAFDALALFINSSVLVTAGSPGADDRPVTLGPGQVVGAYEVEQLVSALVDTEVYRVRDQAGVALALKLARPEIPDDFLDGEARVLQSLGGGRSPALVEHGHFQGRPFLALEWRPGVPVTVAAQRARADRRRLHAVCLGVLDAYAWLHERDVVHGDVHPGNVLVADDGAVTVLDFGRGPDAPRAGIPQFHEPELAAAVLDARTLPPPTPAGEQFAVGALLYQLIAGVDQLEFSPEREVLLTQLEVSQPPLPFAARGVASWPAVEAVLATALAKRPDERFASLAAFRDAFARADVPPQRRRQPRAAARRLVAEALAATPSDRAEALDLGGSRCARRKSAAIRRCSPARMSGEPGRRHLRSRR